MAAHADAIASDLVLGCMSFAMMQSCERAGMNEQLRSGDMPCDYTFKRHILSFDTVWRKPSRGGEVKVYVAWGTETDQSSSGSRSVAYSHGYCTCTV